MTDEVEDIGFRELRMLMVDDAEIEGRGTEIDRLERWKLDECADQPAALQAFQHVGRYLTS